MRSIMDEGSTDEPLLYLALLLIFVITVVAIRFFLRTLPRPVWLLEKFSRPGRLFRVFFVMLIIALLSRGVAELLNQIFLAKCIVMIMFAVIVAFSMLFCFLDMTKKQIAVSAVIPTLVLIGFWIKWVLLKDGIGDTIVSGILTFSPFIYVFSARSKRPIVPERLEG